MCEPRSPRRHLHLHEQQLRVQVSNLLADWEIASGRESTGPRKDTFRFFVIHNSR